MPADLPLIGVARADITPPVGIVLSGYRDRISTSLGHRLRAEAVVCRAGRTGWALVMADTLGFSGPYALTIRRAIAKRLRLPVASVLLGAIHTHSGPPTWRPKQPPRSREARYCAALVGKLADLAATAAAGAQPGWFESTTIAASAWGQNRRIKKADGTWANEWRDPQRRHPGYFDPDLMLVGVRRSDGRLDALLMNYGVHPVVLGPQSLAISSDYVGYLKDAVEASNKVGTAIFALGGHANINPPVCIMKSGTHPRRMGRALARLALAALPRLKPLSALPLAAATLPWSMVRPQRPNQARIPGRWRSSITALRAGGLGIVALPGELFSEYQRRIRAASPLPATMVLSIGNDYIGYLPTDAAQREGAYEARAAAAKRLEKPLLKTVSAALKRVSAGRSARAPAAPGARARRRSPSRRRG